MRFLSTIVALMALTCCGTTYAQSCYSGNTQSYGVNTVYPQTFTTTHTVNVPVQVTVQHQVQAFAAPQCSQSFGANLYANPSFSCGSANFRSNFQSYGSYGGGFNGFSSFGAVGGRGVSLSAQDRAGTQLQALGTRNVRINRGLLGRINGASVDRGFFGNLFP